MKTLIVLAMLATTPAITEPPKMSPIPNTKVASSCGFKPFLRLAAEWLRAVHLPGEPVSVDMGV